MKSDLFEYISDDGGRKNYYKGRAKDCVCRAIAITSGMDYKDTYDLIKDIVRQNPGKGINIKTQLFRTMMETLGYAYGVVKKGSAHLMKGELPDEGKIICVDNSHAIAVIDGVVHDTFDSRYDRWGRLRMIYGYWKYK